MKKKSEFTTLSGASRKSAAGRPIKNIDLEQVKSFCEACCTQEEICNFLKVSIETLNRHLKAAGYVNFEGFYKKYSAHGKLSLRRFQYKAAQEGNATMLVWLGKQWIGQRENPDDIPIKLLSKAAPGQSRLEVLMKNLEQRETLTHKQALDEVKVHSSIKLANKVVEEQSKMSIEEQKSLLDKIDQILEKNEIDSKNNNTSAQGYQQTK